MLIAPPIIQLLLFSFASTLAVENAHIVVLNRDSGSASTEIIQQISGSSKFTDVRYVRSEAQVEDAIRTQRAIAGIKFPENFSSLIADGQISEIRVVLDGRRSNAAQIVNSYLTEIAGNAGATLTSASGQQTSSLQNPVTVLHAFNPNLEEFWNVLPSLMGIIACMTTLSVTAQSVARERELGTFEQLLTTPLQVHEILIGKSIPALLVGLLNTTIFLLATVYLFGVPLQGSLILLYFSLFFYLLAVVGVGLLISSLSMTQQQAFLGTFVFLTPAILLSGYASPIENIPYWLERLSLANPIRHFITIVQGIFLKDMSFYQVLSSAVPLAVIAGVTLTMAAWLFRRRME